MAYQNVGRPRFFIDNYQYLKAIGLDFQEYLDFIESVTGEEHNLTIGQGTDSTGYTNFYTPIEYPDLFNLNPQNAIEIELKGEASLNPVTYDCFPVPYIPFFNTVPYNSDLWDDNTLSSNLTTYVAFLNHNLELSRDDAVSMPNQFGFSYFNTIGDSNTNQPNDDENVLNAEGASVGRNGSSILIGEKRNARAIISPWFRSSTHENTIRIGSVSVGFAYTMPHSPDLSVSMETEFDGYDKIETLGGSTLTNIRHTGTPLWSNGDKFNFPFSVDDALTSMNSPSGESRNFFEFHPNNEYLGGAKRNGRRNWNLKFSLVSDEDLFSSNYSSTYHREDIHNNETGYNPDDFNSMFLRHNIFTDNSFMAQVWNKTLGGALPFIFQPDSNNNNPDQFCIAEFDQDSLKVTQTAFRTYSFSVKIREVW